MLRVSDCIGDGIWAVIPQATEWQCIGNDLERKAIVPPDKP